MKTIKEAYTIDDKQSKAEVILFDSLEKFMYTMHDRYNVICWQHQGVYRGVSEDHKIKWTVKKGVHKSDPSMESMYWQRARFFNEKEEYLITIRKGKIFGRHRVDGKGANIKCIKSEAVLRSIVVNPDLVTSESGTECIQLINYLGFDNIGKVKVVDMRFVDFKTI